MANTTQNWDSWKDEINAYIKDESNKGPQSMYSKLFGVETTSDLSMTENGWSGFGLMQEVGEMGNAVEDDPIEGYAYTYARKTFRKKTVFSSTLFETAKTLKVEEMSRDLPRSVEYSRDMYIFGVFRNAWNPLWTYGDSKTLCSLYHPLKNGSGTQANTFLDGVQSALSIDAVKRLQDVHYDMVTNSGNMLTIGQKPILLITPYNRVKAFEIADSDGKPETTDNERNFYKGNLYDILEIPFLKYEAARQMGEITAAKSNSANYYDTMWGLIDPEIAKKYFKVKIGTGYAKYDDEVLKNNQSLVKYAYDVYTFGTTGYFPAVLSKGDGSTLTI